MIGRLVTGAVALLVGVLALTGGPGERPEAMTALRASATGALSLTNSHAETAILDGRDLKPGDEVSGTMTIGNDGTGDAAVTLETSDVEGHARAGRRPALPRTAPACRRHHRRGERDL